MAEAQTDPHAAILTWLDDFDHEDWCRVRTEGPDKQCDCALGLANAAIRASLQEHPTVTNDDMQWCQRDGSRVPCSTVQAIADALGVAT